MVNVLLYELFPAVCNMSLTASVVIVFVLLARLLLKKAPKIFSYALWGVVLFRLLCPVSVTAGFSLLGLLNAPARETAPRVSSVEYVQPNIVHAESPQVHLPVPAVKEAVSNPLPSEQAQMGDPLEAPVSVISCVYLAGAAAMLLYSAGSLLKLRRRLVGAAPLRDNIYLADHIASPFVMGVVRPRIYLPSSLSEREQSYIILHEQHHIRRLDPLLKLLSFAALSIHWFNPLVWAAFVLSGEDMEMSCDEAVVRKLGEGIRADYSASLLRLSTGRRIIAGTPLAFGEGSTASRIRNMLRWKRPKVWMVLLAAAACVAVIAACAANPRESDGGQRGQYAGMEDFAQQTMDRAETVTYYSVSGGEATASVIDRKVAWLEKQGEVDGLAPEGVLEAWTFNYLVKIDAPAEDVSLVGGMYEEDGWYDLEGQGGHDIVALRHADGSYDVLYNRVVNDGMAFYGYHESYEEAVYDWYVTENNLDLPLYVKDWTDQAAAPEGSHAGNIPVHRFDGDGWYLYIPIQIWSQPIRNSVGNYECWSLYETGSGWILGKLPDSVEQVKDGYAQQGRSIASSIQAAYTATLHRDPKTDIAYLFDAGDGGCYVLHTIWYDDNITISPYAAMEPAQLTAMAESFTVDPRFAADASDAGSGEAAPLDVASAMRSVAARLSAGTDAGELALAAAMNEAAGRSVDGELAAYAGYLGNYEPYWSHTLSLGDGSILDIRCGLTENIVEVQLRKDGQETAAFFEDAQLYQLIRHGRDYDQVVDQAAYERFRDILTGQMRDTCAVMAEKFGPFTGYQLTRFCLAYEEYDAAQGETVQLYDFDFALLTDHPEQVVWAGGMYLDGDLRVQGVNDGGPFAVRYRKGELVCTAFMPSDFQFPQDEEDRGWARETISAALDEAEAKAG